MFKKIWNFLDGNKTTIGSMLVAAGRFLPPDVAIFTDIIGLAIGGTGTVHKVRKAVVKAKAKKMPDSIHY